MMLFNIINDLGNFYKLKIVSLIQTSPLYPGLLPSATKLGQGYIFTGVCDSVHTGGCLPQCMLGYHPSLPGAGTPPPQTRHPRIPMDQAPHAHSPWTKHPPDQAPPREQVPPLVQVTPYCHSVKKN